MNQRALIIAAILFVVIVAGMFAYAYMRQNHMQNTEPPVQEEPQEDEGFTIDRVDAKHYFIDGTHTVAGEINMPTPCDLLETNAIVRESDPEQVTVTFEVINNSGDMCAQVITPQRFKVSFDASADAEIDATFRGEPAQLNLVEAEEGEDPADFELFIKG